MLLVDERLKRCQGPSGCLVIVKGTFRVGGTAEKLLTGLERGNYSTDRDVVNPAVMCFRQLRVVVECAVILRCSIPAVEDRAVLYGPKTYATPLAGAPAAKTEPLIATGEPYSPPVTVASEVGRELFHPVEGSM